MYNDADKVVIKKLLDAIFEAFLPIASTEAQVRNGEFIGLKVVFHNKMTLSVIWHEFAYSNIGRGSAGEDEPITVEAAAWFPDGTWFNPYKDADGDDVRAYITIDQVVEFARQVAEIYSDTKPVEAPN